MYKLAITTLSTAMFLSAVGYAAAPRPSDTKSMGADSHAVSIRGYVLGSDGTPLAGTDVCVYDGATQNARGCATSGSDGSFALSSAANELLVVTFRKEGFAPTTRAIETAAVDSRQGEVAFLVTASGAHSATASVTRTAAESQGPLYFSVALDRETTAL
jgi:hypothetical protein